MESSYSLAEESRSNTGEISPEISESSVQLHSSTESVLRQRHVNSAPTVNKTNNTIMADNYKDDIHYNGRGFYECNICFDTAVHPVLTLCGHLFCWSCLAQWLNAQSRNPNCPVCKAGCGKDKVIPIYGRGKEEKDPRNDPSIPTRPAGQRPPPLHDPNRPTTSFFGPNPFTRNSMSISAGLGFFPLVGGVAFNTPSNSLNTTQSPQGAFVSRLVMMLLSLLIVAIVFA